MGYREEDRQRDRELELDGWRERIAKSLELIADGINKLLAIEEDRKEALRRKQREDAWDDW